jgi:filamentous hemagglutinin family protein
MLLALVVPSSGPMTCTAYAGDLLRGGYTTSQGGNTSPGSFTPPSVAKARQQANDLLARTTQAIQSVSAMQSKARQLAISGANSLGANPNNTSQALPTVVDGLNAGGLVPDSGLKSAGVANTVSDWENAGTPTQTTNAKGQTTVDVDQTGADAVLYWNSFNIGKHTTLDIDQSAGGANEDTWIAFNMIEDPSGVPSQILGSIKAGGQVYVINQNGIIFGGSSQVNVHTLVASSLPIDQYYITNGLLNDPGYQFLFSAIPQAAGSGGSPPAFTPPAYHTGADGDVIVEAGAQIYSPANAQSVGGRVALIGPNVTNDGDISTPDGQTILAAGLQVGFTASSDPTLRGLDVYVGPVSDSVQSGGLATNNGIISVPGGDAYMVGATVDQLAVIASTTTVSLNGRIDLDADYDTTSVSGVGFYQQLSGTVLLGNGSVTQVLPDWASDATITTGQFQLYSQVNIQGLAIHMAGDAAIFAPDARGTDGAPGVNLNAGAWDFFSVNGGYEDDFANTAPSQIYLDSGAAIDVQGSWDVSAPVSQNIIPVQLLGPELADSPLQRDGPLAGQTIYVDIRDTGEYDGEEWVGTPLVDDVQSFVDLIPYTVGELTIGGGSVGLNAGGSVVLQKGSRINVSGGWIDYQGGTVQTSEVISDGNIYPINEATPNLVYQGFNLGTFSIIHPKYAVTQTYLDPILDLSHYEDSYVQGADAGGSLSITAPATALDGQLTGLTVAGPRQLSALPAPSQFSLAYSTQSSGNSAAPGTEPAPVAPNIIFSTDDNLPVAAPFSEDSSGEPAGLTAARQGTVILSPNLVGAEGFGSLDISVDFSSSVSPGFKDVGGNITVPAGVSLDAGADGSVTLAGANIDIQGSVSAPGGTLTFTSYDYNPFTSPNSYSTTPPRDPDRGSFTLGPSAVLSTAGLNVDNREGVADADTEPLVTAGGKISISSLVADLDNGSVIDVSGGLVMGTSGVPSYADGGSILIKAGVDPVIASISGGSLTMNSTLLGYSGATGGSLTLYAPVIQVGGASADSSALLLSPNFFSQGGFVSFTVDGIGAGSVPGISIAPGVQIDPVVTSLIVNADTSGPNLSTFQAILPVGQRPPVDLAFNAPGLNDSVSGILKIAGDVFMGTGSVIKTDPLGSVSFDAQTTEILGSIYVPGGTISITGVADSSKVGTASDYLPTVEIGPQTVLSAAGVVVLTPNAQGYTTGNVLPGGSIAISGNIVAEAGSVINVSGASGVLDVSPLALNEGLDGLSVSESILNISPIGSFGGALMVPTGVNSNGGTITLTGGEDLFTNATLLGRAGGPSATGGTLIISSGLSDPNIPPSTPTLTVTQKQSPFSSHGKEPLLNPVYDANGNQLTALPDGYFGVDTFLSGGFSSLTLHGSVLFQGPVDIQADGSLVIATGGLIEATQKVTLQAPYVALGQVFVTPQASSQPEFPFTFLGSPSGVAPTNGAGEITVIADLIDVGNLSLDGIGAAHLIAENGDIRGDGTLDIQGNLTMDAGQIYPATEVTFQIDAYDTPGSVDVASSTLGSTTVTLESAAPTDLGVGSTLLGSTVEGIKGTTITLNSGANATISSPASEAFLAPGTVTFKAAGRRETPLSGGGTLDVYATIINQGGVLRAPGGSITLGWDGSGTDPFDDVIQGDVEASRTVTLSAGSTTSVSEIDSLTGQPLVIPYGIDYNGTDWIDPAGNDITTGGVPAKKITISAATVNDEHGATIDIRGGGDLMAYQFVPGLQGNNDPLLSTASFAVIPGYQAPYAPYGPFNLSLPNNEFNGDPGYANSNLAVGEQVYLDAEGTLPAGLYTLLPARYALVPGGYLVTPIGNTAVINQTLPDGSYRVSGYQLNAFQTARTAQPLFTSFQVEPGSVINDNAQYTIVLANQFLAQSAASNNAAVPRLPTDSGQLIFNATEGLSVEGRLDAQSLSGGLGGLVDISSPDAIVIADPGATSSAPDTLVLDANELSSFGAGSLLIGGTRDITGNDATVTAESSSITVDNSADPLTGQDIILVSTDGLTVDQGAEIKGSGAASDAEDINITGNGALVRVSSDSSATVSRTLATTASPAELAVAAGARITGASVTLDSSSGTDLDPDAIIQGKSVALNSGQITIEFANPGSGAPTAAPASGLILSGNVLPTLFGNAESLSLLSYSSLDIYGAGDLGTTNSSGQPVLQNLSLSAAQINGFNSTGGNVLFAAQNILLNNAADITDNATATANTGGTLGFSADKITLGANALAVNQFASVALNASTGITVTGVSSEDSQGDSVPASFAVQGGDLTLSAPVITGAAGAAQTISTSGMLTIAAPATPSESSLTGGLGATLQFIGATGLADDSTITAHSGSVTLQATSGNLDIGNFANATIDVSGQAKTFFDLTKYTSGGQVNLIADEGGVDLGAKSTINVGYTTTVEAGGVGGNAGTLTINAPQGSATLLGTLIGQGGVGEANGSFSLNASSIPAVVSNGQTYPQGSLDPIDAILDAGGFTQSITISDQTDASVTIGSAGLANEPVVIADAYNVSANGGSVTVYGTINAANVASTDPNGNPISIGGTITLQAEGSVTIGDGATLTVAAQNFSNAGQGGTISLEAGSDVNGVASSTGYVNIQAGATINLSVGATPVVGDVGGALLLRAPQLGSQANPTGVQVAAIDGTIIGSTNSAAPSTITVEGYSIFNTATDGSQGVIDNEESNVAANGDAFAGNTGSFTVSGNTVTGSGIEGGLLSGDASLPGGNLALAGAVSSGAVQLVVEPGAEIINPSSSVNGGNLELQTSWDLSTDRFGPDKVAGVLTLRAANNVIFDFGASLSDGFSSYRYFATLLSGPSWSYQITSGADFGSADASAVDSAAALALLPSFATGNSTASVGSVLLGYNAPALPTVTETSLKNEFATYFQAIRTGDGDIDISAGQDVQILNSLATIYTAGVSAPALPANFLFSTPLGTGQGLVNAYPAQYSYEGGNVAVSAQGNIEHLVLNSLTGDLQPDSSLEMPTSWLNRRGNLSASGISPASTTWWVDFQDFFEGVGALGGGNVTLAAGQDIENVDAVIPTNGRVSENDSMVEELGGGNLSVTAGDDINGGSYYVERGDGVLSAGGSIITNYTRSDLTKSFLTDIGGAANSDSASWLPTTLFLGAGSFNVSAAGSIEIGDVANPFLLPQDIFNASSNKTYFSTYGLDDIVDISALGGNVTLQGGTSLYQWYLDVYSILPGNVPTYGSTSQPWLQTFQALQTNALTGIAPLFSILPPTVRATAFSASIDLQGGLTLSPAADGTLELAAQGAINGLQPTSFSTGNSEASWTEGVINVSDADPGLIPGIESPLGLPVNFLNIDQYFDASGSVAGPYAVIQNQELLHKKGLLHAQDQVPVRIYAATGDVSGFTLYSPKVTRVIAGLDITDIAFYIQNDSSDEVSVVSAGRDLVPYDPNSFLRQEAQSPGNELLGVAQGVDSPGSADANAGDIQIGGPGTIELLAGRNLSAGVGPNNTDGTAVGFTSIGNAADPYLPSTGAEIIMAAGLGEAADGLEGSSLDLQAFAKEVLNSAAGATYFADLATTEDFNVPNYAAYQKLSKERQAIVALDLFYLVLRDTGRDHNLIGNPGYGNYAAGDAAIHALLSSDHASSGDINLTSKELTTERGGDIDVLDPAGQITVGVNLSGAQPVEQGIFTDDGGNISMYTQGSVDLGTSRVFTLQGGNIIIWSNGGNVDAGNSSKTVQSAPPTRVVVDPQSGNVETDLAGLATGGGIGVLDTVVGEAPGDVDLIAPTGTINAGDAGIRATGNLNLAAVQILNASNISAGGASSGVPTVTVAAPNLGALAAASSTAGAGVQAADSQASAQNQAPAGDQDQPSIIDVEVLGYGGGDSDNDIGG